MTYEPMHSEQTQSRKV